MTPTTGTRVPRTGIGLRAPHYRALLQTLPPVGWLEVHSENYFGDGGTPLDYLERAREHYALSLHGVGLSLGSTDPLDRDHLRRLKRLVERFDPIRVSDHLCWSSHQGIYLNDLLPLPYTEEALAHVSTRVAEVQDYLGRELLVENVSSYLRFTHSTLSEWEFLAALAERADCAILLDLNNVHVSASNNGFEAQAYLHGVPTARVGEIHLAGFAVNSFPEGEMLIDDHGAPVSDAVWALYTKACETLAAVPVMIEWDTKIPPLYTLVEEARKADTIREQLGALAR